MGKISSKTGFLSLHKLFPLRPRYVLTKSNVPRLRYVAATALFVAALSTLSAFTPEHEDQAAFKTARAASSITVENTSTLQIQNPHFQTVSLIDRLPFVGADNVQAEKNRTKTIRIKPGDTLSKVMEKSGITATDAYKIVEAVSEHFDPRRIFPGQRIEVNYKDNALENVILHVDKIKTVNITPSQNSDDFVAALMEKELTQETLAKKATIQTSLYGSAAKAGIPAPIIAEAIRIYSWDIDFQRDIRSGDGIEVLYTASVTEDGDFAGYGDILYANLTVGGKEIPLYRFKTEDGIIDYFDRNGDSARKTLMKTPIDGARMSSGYGMRRHPILGYNKMHKGVDFAAPTGTPIYAAGDGTVDFVGTRSGYGKYIRLRHNGNLKTAYAHMSRYAKGLHKGQRVSQGDIIGYVGSTGRSTGPHLHYEVLVNGKQVNPRSVDLPTGISLEGNDRNQFLRNVKAKDRSFDRLLPEELRMASNSAFNNHEQ